jgi:iron complex outermembrane receptor protein
LKIQFMKNLFTLLFLVFLSNGLIAQSNIKVHVEDANKNTLPGATIVVKGTTNGTSTDIDGNASINTLSTDSIIVSLIGYNVQTISVGNNSSLTVILTSSDIQLGEMVVVGTRSAGRIRTETTAPVDVISVSSLMTNSGRADITSMLNYAAPSLNANKQSGSDGADHIDLATLRGLGPDQTLVLVNGKRRHQTAFVAVYGTRGRGNSGTDLSAIPVSAIDRIEILRDGASAQYGSDAIAGVINIVTKKTTGYFTGDIGYGAYADKEFNPAIRKSN